MKDKKGCGEGIAFTSKKVLQYAVILLGFGLNLATIGKVGMTSLPHHCFFYQHISFSSIYYV